MDATAQVAWTDDWQTDAARRDFTINALSLDRQGGLHDYFGGQGDLVVGRVRFVGRAGLRIAEDYLRVLRYFRFFARYGRGAPDGEAAEAIAAAVGGLAQLSAERVWSELKRILQAPAPVAALRLMARLGVLAAVLPEGGDVARLEGLVARGAPADPLLRMAALLGGDTQALALRLKLSQAEAARLLALRHGPVAEGDDAALRRLLAEEEAATLIDRVWLADLPRGLGAELRARLGALERPVFPLEGRDALALGASPGPAVGAALREVRRWWKERGCVASPQECRQRLAAELGKENAVPV